MGTVEIWKPVDGFAGYEVSNLGNIRSYWTAGRSAYIGKTPRVMLKRVNFGYNNVCFRCGGKSLYRRIARLVLTAFVRPPRKGEQACHIDGDRQNDALVNLRWDTQKGNEKDKIRHGTTSRGERNGQAKLTVDKIDEIFSLREQGLSQSRIGSIFGVSQTQIGRILRKERWYYDER